MITSLLDTDLYKFTMMQVVLHHFPDVEVEYQFKLRSSDIDLAVFADEIQRAINDLTSLSFTQSELDYLASLDYIKPDYVEYLSNFKLNSQHIKLWCEPEFKLTIKGPWLETILYEVPILAIISEIYFSQYSQELLQNEGKHRLVEKVNFVNNADIENDFLITDFGTRRRYSKSWQEIVIQYFRQHCPQHFIGTSNVYFAKKYQLTPIGTMAHEYIQAFQALAPELKNSQKMAFEMWLDEYQDKLGIALSDTLSLSAFLNDFNQQLANQFSGARQDSGDPIIWAEALIAHYQQMGIDPTEKMLVFSDSLTLKKAIAIYQALRHKAKLRFGIGTYLTNDMGVKPLDMVVKMVRCNNRPVAKISDSAGKAICLDDAYLQKLKTTFHLA